MAGYSVAVPLLVASFAAPAFLPAAEPAPAQAILDTGWASPTEAFERAREQYEALKPASRDVRAAYAMTLVAIRHHRARDARQYIDAALAARPNNLHLRQARLWIMAWGKDVKGTLAELPAIAKDLTTVAHEADEKAAAEHDQEARTLGEIVAFLAGPADSRMPEAQLAAVEEKIRGQLRPRALEAFSAGHDAVTERYKTLDEQWKKARADLAATKQVDRDLAREKRTRQRGQLAKAADQGVPAAYRQKVQELQTKRNRLQAELTNLPVVLEGQPNNLRDRNHQRREHLTKEIGRVDVDLANLPAQAEQALSRLGAADDHAARRIARLDKLSEKAADDKADDDAKTLAMRAKIVMLATYCEFPLEAERERLLKTVAGSVPK